MEEVRGLIESIEGLTIELGECLETDDPGEATEVARKLHDRVVELQSELADFPTADDV